ncbi:chemotaxis protein CheC [Lachnospiraceae bacterium NSJ-29]|uniref:Chemotaxis protein CheC n=1 Tax=Wansuia hejianensis TaxID=2763667 RepID=A0A926EXU4_9FIRM|nr:chemotaxis protein CheC [Wansuia hejianensis]
MLNKGKFTDLQIDIIKELVNIGGGNAATSISQLISKPVNMTVPIIEILDYNQVYENIMMEDQMVNAVVTRMLGDAEGIFLFIVNDETADNLANMMMPEGIEQTMEIRDSAIKELVNTLVSSFLNATSKEIGRSLISSVPLLTKDMFGAILSSVYIESGQYDEDIMIIKNEFSYLGEKIESSLYFVPNPGVLEKLFKIIGV